MVELRDVNPCLLVLREYQDESQDEGWKSTDKVRDSIASQSSNPVSSSQRISWGSSDPADSKLSYNRHNKPNHNRLDESIEVDKRNVNLIEALNGSKDDEEEYDPRDQTNDIVVLKELQGHAKYFATELVENLTITTLDLFFVELTQEHD